MDSQSYSPSFQLKPAPVAICVAMLGVGALLGFSGMIVGTAGMVSITRKWWAEIMDEVPQSAKPKWTKQSKMAMTEGTRVMAGNGAPAPSGRS
jgi:hypothetical protein